MVRVHLDFESRSKADIWSCGAYRYSQDPSTEVLCLAYSVDDEPVQLIEREYFKPTQIWNGFFFGNFEQKIKTLKELALDPEVTFVAHNAFFEQCIWENILVPHYEFPILPAYRWECTAAKALSHGLPKALADVAKALNLSSLKDEEGKRVMMKMAKPRKPTKSDPSEWHESPEDFQTLYNYCKQDVEVERAVDKALPSLTHTEQKVWVLDQEINKRGIRVDLELVEKALEFATLYTEKLNKRLFDLTQGEVEGHTKRMALMRWLEKNEYPLENTQSLTVRTALANDKNMPPVVREVLEIKTKLGKSSVSKYKAFKESTCEDGRLRDILVYHSASTGRWGGKIVQLQNLPRGSVKYTDAAAQCIKSLSLSDFEKLYPDVMGTLSSCIRSALLPDEDEDMQVADYSSIEARVIAWLAGQFDILETFRKGECVYCQEASGIFGRPVTKKDKFERTIGKVAVLALGYQGGIGAFASMADIYEIDLEPVYNILAPTMTQEEMDTASWSYKFYSDKVADPMPVKSAYVADVIKQRWRKKNEKIQTLWAETENAAINAVLDPTKGYEAGKCCWVMGSNRPFLYCILPSGRMLAYHKPQIKQVRGKYQLTYMTLLSQTKQYVRTAAYGGKLVENITQAVARDIMANAMLEVASTQEYKVLLTVHDEIITSCPRGIDTQNLEKTMCKLPYWAEGLPVGAEGWKGPRYKK